jgi:hypothetical protein
MPTNALLVHITCTAAVVFAAIGRRRRSHRRHGGSVISKRANRDIGRATAGERLDADYFERATHVDCVAIACGDVRPTFSEPELLAAFPYASKCLRARAHCRSGG